MPVLCNWDYSPGVTSSCVPEELWTNKVTLNYSGTGAFPALLKICHTDLLGPVWEECDMKCIKLKVLGWLISSDVKAKGPSTEKRNSSIPG